VPQPLPRFLDAQFRKLEDEEKLVRILLETGEATPESSAGATAAGDGRRLRGIPCHARGTGGGAIAGTDPLRALLAKQRRS
jgi:hypothetical protein